MKTNILILLLLAIVHSPLFAQDTKYSEHEFLVDAGKHNKGNLELLILRLTASALSYSKGYADMFGVVKPQIFLYEEGYVNKIKYLHPNYRQVNLSDVKDIPMEKVESVWLDYSPDYQIEIDDESFSYGWGSEGGFIKIKLKEE